VGLGIGDNLGAKALGGLALMLDRDQQGLRLFAQAQRLVQLRLDLGAAIVQRLHGQTRNLGADQDGEEDHHADGDPDLGVLQELHQASPRAWAALSWAAVGALPVSFSTMAPAVSSAIWRTLLMAWSRDAIS